VITIMEVWKKIPELNAVLKREEECLMKKKRGR
jgi:hypothetical protein